MHQNFSKATLAAMEAALLAGELLKKGFGTQFSISEKEGKHNLVTEYDRKAEAAILQFLRREFPEIPFLAEESGSSGTASNSSLWIIDPLDGTVNFAHDIPIFCVSIALEREGGIVTGIIYQPLTEELFVAEKGRGAFLNGKPISVSSTSLFARSILATGFPYNVENNPFHCIEHFIEIVKQGLPIRRLGSAALDLAYTASGRFDGFFEVGLSPWDCAAGKLLVEEAGGRVTHWDQKPFHIHSKRPLLATNGHIHEELAGFLHRTI
ncbi:MAG: inositol monophosphatase [Verrucomicrobiota bacterium]|nr:inositol monophosphatase [Verrucomicrobiota bacterium]